MSRIVPLAAGALAAAMLLPATTQVVSAKEYLIRYSDIGANQGPRAAALQVWKKEIEEESKGKLKIKFFWGQSLMRQATLKGVGSGRPRWAPLSPHIRRRTCLFSTTATSRSTSPIPGSVSALCRMFAKTGVHPGGRKEEQDPDAVPKRYRPRASPLRQRADRHTREAQRQEDPLDRRLYPAVQVDGCGAGEDRFR